MELPGKRFELELHETVPKPPLIEYGAVSVVFPVFVRVYMKTILSLTSKESPSLTAKPRTVALISRLSREPLYV